jgi:biopolymer transport protein TolQ
MYGTNYTEIFIERRANNMKLFLGNSIWYLVSKSDGMTKFVLLGLLMASIISWTIVLYKLVMLRIKKADIKSTLKQLRRTKTVDEVIACSSLHAKKYPGHLLVNQLNATQELLRKNKTLSAHQLEILDDTRYDLIDDMARQEEMYLPFLSTTASVAPLVGLFGTVWGLTHAFISISEKGSADIVTIAPGIAEALLTTVAGLMVAIPAAVLYHYLIQQADSIVIQLNKISNHVHRVVQGTFVDIKEYHEDTKAPEKTAEANKAASGN